MTDYLSKIVKKFVKKIRQTLCQNKFVKKFVKSFIIVYIPQGSSRKHRKNNLSLNARQKNTKNAHQSRFLEASLVRKRTASLKIDSLQIRIWLFDLMNTLLDLFCFMIRHSFRSSLWSSNILKLVHSLGFDFLNFKTLITLSHWSKFLSLTLFTKEHSSLSCRWWVIWHFSEQIFNPQVSRQSLEKKEKKC